MPEGPPRRRYPGSQAPGLIPKLGRRLARSRCILRSSGGFTLIEIMVVMVILGILAISIIAIYQDLTTRARQAADDGTLGALRSAVSQYVAKNGATPPDTTVLDSLVSPTPPQFLYYAGYAYDPATGIVTGVP